MRCWRRLQNTWYRMDGASKPKYTLMLNITNFISDNMTDNSQHSSSRFAAAGLSQKLYMRLESGELLEIVPSSNGLLLPLNNSVAGSNSSVIPTTCPDMINRVFSSFDQNSKQNVQLSRQNDLNSNLNDSDQVSRQNDEIFDQNDKIFDQNDDIPCQNAQNSNVSNHNSKKVHQGPGPSTKKSGSKSKSKKGGRRQFMTEEDERCDNLSVKSIFLTCYF